MPQHSGSTPPNASGAMATPQDLWRRSAGPSRSLADLHSRFASVTVKPRSTLPWWCSRCQAIVCGPASRPCPANSLRNRTMPLSWGTPGLSHCYSHRPERSANHLNENPEPAERYEAGCGV